MVSLPETYKAAVATAKNVLELKDLPLKHPGKGQVLVKVLACGVCFTDHSIMDEKFGDVFPRVPGHELVGDVVELGEGVERLSVGERVGGPWHGGHDATCGACQKGVFQACVNRAVNGFTQDGGYAEYVLLRDEAVVRVPRDMDPTQVAPLLCAGVTVFNGLRKLHVEQGGIVAVQGIGGLGHLAVQFASKMGYHVVAISRGEAKRDFALKLGASTYIDTNTEDAAARLTELGGADAVLCTAPSGKAISPLVKGLRIGGKLLIVAVAGVIEVDTTALLSKGASVQGWPSGHARDSEDTIKFAKEKGVTCMVEKFPLRDVKAAVDHMVSGQVRFRGVLTME